MKLKTLSSIITLSIIATTDIQASTQNNIPEVASIAKSPMPVTTIYQSMTTAQLQIEVEKHSNNENLSFVLGTELIKRWTNS